MAIRIVDIDLQNREIALTLAVEESQSGFIETVQECLQEAKELSLWKPIIIYDDETPIGFAMYGHWKDEGSDGRVWLDRFFIDKNYQKKGFAKKALEVLLTVIKEQYKCNEVYLSLYANNKVAEHLYLNFDFVYNGEIDLKGELIMVNTNPSLKAKLKALSVFNFTKKSAIKPISKAFTAGFLDAF